MEITGIYRHFKGNYYEVLGLATDADTADELVVYRQMYGDFGLWLRPREMFFGLRQTESGPLPRFRRVGVSFEHVLEQTDFCSLTLRHSESEADYRIVRPLSSDGTPAFEVKKI